MDSRIAMYRRYRGTDFDQIYGQDHVIEPLKRSIEAGRVSHAYLLTGPRGVGKTSVARIIAHKINGVDYELGTLPIDIIEIDAASNRRIDEIRDLREKVHIAPVQAKYKVYIIDEVHMLTREAFNALLKTLEEPPAHAVFVLATTEIHKLPATIISRTQRYNFKPIADEVTTKQLQSIAKKEGITIDKPALQLLAEHSDGSLRDGVSLLDQISTHKSQKIDKDTVSKMLGLPAENTLNELYQAVQSSSTRAVVEKLDELHSAGFNSVAIAEQLIRQIRQKQRYDNTIAMGNIELIDELLSVASARKPQLQLEVVLLKAAVKRQVSTTQNQTEPSERTSSTTVADSETEPPTKSTDNKPNEEATSAKSLSSKKAFKQLDEEVWNQVLKEIKKQNNALYAVLRMSIQHHQENQITLKFKYPFHQRRASESRNRQLLTELLHQSLGPDISIEMTVDSTLTADKARSDNTEKDPTAAIISAFGGGEVVEI